MVNKDSTKDKNKKPIWVKNRHKRVFAFLRVLMTPFVGLRYNFKCEKSKLPKGPYLIISNHQSTMDPFFLSLSFKFPIYFIASDDIFNLKVSPLIKYLVAPIPKSKSMKDLTAMKNVIRVIKEGGAVGIFPEGNRTLSGGQWELDDAIAKLAKNLKVPLVIYNISGGYGADPRWGHCVRKGKMNGYIKRVISPEEISTLSVEELFKIIKTELKVDDTNLNIKFQNRKRAEYIERVLYICPVCGAVSSFVSHKDKFICKNCNVSAEYTPNLKISPTVKEYNRIYEWFEWERNEIVNRVLSGEKFFDDNIIFRESIKLKRKKKLLGDRVTIDIENLTISSKKGQMVFPLKDITAITMVGKKKFNFYFSDKILQVKGNKRFCAIKYVHIFDGLRKKGVL